MDSFGRLPHDVLEQIKFMYFKPKYEITSEIIDNVFEIICNSNDIKICIHLWHPLNLEINESSLKYCLFNAIAEWECMYDAIENDSKHQLDIDQYENKLMIKCTGDQLQLRNNIIDINLSLNVYKYELLKVIRHLLNNISLFSCRDFDKLD